MWLVDRLLATSDGGARRGRSQGSEQGAGPQTRKPSLDGVVSRSLPRTMLPRNVPHAAAPACCEEPPVDTVGPQGAGPGPHLAPWGWPAAHRHRLLDPKAPTARAASPRTRCPQTQARHRPEPGASGAHSAHGAESLLLAVQLWPLSPMLCRAQSCQPETKTSQSPERRQVPWLSLSSCARPRSAD